MSERSDQSQAWPWLRRGFATTRWSLVKRAVPGNEGRERPAAELCRLYWHPLYAFLRSRGWAEGEAQDLVQSFLVRMAAGDFLEAADAARGRFRTYLLTLLLRHASRESRSQAARKRGGGVEHVPLEWALAEAALQRDLQDRYSPEDVFRRALATRLVEEAVDLLRARYRRTGQEAVCEVLLPALEGPVVGEGYAALAARLEMREGGVRVAVVRLRQRFRECLCRTAAVALRIPEGPELEEELRSIFG